MTEKLFYEDSHMVTFQAVVEQCGKAGTYYEAVLDRTAFFPEGGGQAADTGTIDGIEVVDVQERDGRILHKMTKPLRAGQQVQGRICWTERFSRMQHHSGEHIVSGLVHSTFGYDNVGFHMGKETVTMDFNGSISREQLKEIERRANEAVAKNLDIRTFFPGREELAKIEYRSKIELDGQVRLVEIPGYDVCACCAPHVKKTGEIGLIKLTGVQNYKGGVRVSMLCGFCALADYEKKSETVRTLCAMLSAKEETLPEETERLLGEIALQKQKNQNLQKKVLEYKANEWQDAAGAAVLFEADLTGSAPRELMNLLLEKGVRIAAVFTKETDGRYRYVVGSRTADMRACAKALNERFHGRGGGKPEMVQGTICGKEEEIRAEVAACSERV